MREGLRVFGITVRGELDPEVPPVGGHPPQDREQSAIGHGVLSLERFPEAPYLLPTYAHRDRGSAAQVLPPDVLAGTHNEQGVAVPQVVDRRGVSLATLASRLGEEHRRPAHEPVQ